jgi:hypothetical protein
MIDHNLIARTPTQTFIDNECHDNPLSSIREAPQPIDFIDKYLDILFLYHVRNLSGANRQFPQLINHIMDILLRFSPANINHRLTRSRYKKDIVRAFVITSRGKIGFSLKRIWHITTSSRPTRCLDPRKLLAMVAVVGNMGAVNFYLANAGDIFAFWPTFPSAPLSVQAK